MQSSSPAIDAGSATDAPSDDYEGNARPQDGDGNGSSIHDIGTYEVTPTLTLSSTTDPYPVQATTTVITYIITLQNNSATDATGVIVTSTIPNSTTYASGGDSFDGTLDIRQIDLLAPIMRARLDQCQAKGFNGIEPNNIDGYTNDTGFPLTYQDQLNYNIWLANEAYARGLSISLKNDSDQVADLLPYFDWAMTEDCFDQGWCDQMQPFIAAGKPVFAAEYTDMGMTTEQFCPQAQQMSFSAILKNRDLDAWRKACA